MSLKSTVRRVHPHFRFPNFHRTWNPLNTDPFPNNELLTVQHMFAIKSNPFIGQDRFCSEKCLILMDDNNIPWNKLFYLGKNLQWLTTYFKNMSNKSYIIKLQVMDNNVLRKYFLATISVQNLLNSNIHRNVAITCID